MDETVRVQSLIVLSMWEYLPACVLKMMISSSLRAEMSRSHQEWPIGGENI